MNKLIFLFILSFGIVSCGSYDKTQIDNSDLIGQWQWFSTDGGFGFHIHNNPESTGTEIELNLKSNFMYEIIENGNIVSKGVYKLSMRESIYSSDKERFISYSNNYHNQNAVLSGIIRIISPDTLSIADNSFDGLGSSFKKSD